MPALNAANRKLIDWVAGYTLSAPGAVLKMAMSVDDVFQGIGETDGYAAAQETRNIKMTPARKKVLEAVTEVPKTAAEIARLAGVSPSVVKGLADAGI